VNVKKIQNTKNGKAMIICGDKKSKETLSEAIKESMQDKLEVQVKQRKKLSRMEYVVYKTDMSIPDHDDDLVQDLMSLNDIENKVLNPTIRIVKRIDVRRGKATLIILDIDENTENMLMTNGKGHIKVHGWQSVPIKNI
jgi:hypothetical protein